MGVGRRTARKRAVGTREHIISYLTEVGELFDANGMASTRLAAAVGYPGSSVAFAQLLSGMERSGLIEREVRGKRTYRIRLGPAQVGGTMRRPRWRRRRVGAAGVAGLAGAAGAARAMGPGSRGDGRGRRGDGGRGWQGGGRGGRAGGRRRAAGFDYDELARRLLVQVVRRLAATDPEASTPDRAAPGSWPRGPALLPISACSRRSPDWSTSWPRRGPSTASWPRRTSGCGSSSARRSGRWRRPPNGSAGCPSAPTWTAARSCCCSGCSPRVVRTAWAVRTAREARTERTTPARKGWRRRRACSARRAGSGGPRRACSAGAQVDAGGVAAEDAGQDVGGQAEGGDGAHVPGHAGDAGPVGAEDPLAGQRGQVEGGVVVRQPLRRQPGQVEPDVVAGQRHLGGFGVPLAAAAVGQHERDAGEVGDDLAHQPGVARLRLPSRGRCCRRCARSPARRARRTGRRPGTGLSGPGGRRRAPGAA